MNRLLSFALFGLGAGIGVFAENGEAELLSKVRQLTFEGKRAGEGYFSADGTWLIFQSEREADNPFYQIYLIDLETGDTRRLSPGHGKTTCSWIHPDKTRALFASTHLDPDARRKQQEELELRASGKERRYSWDYDEHFDLFEVGIDSGEMRRLTDALGYDAEGSYSPDGQWIAFASNRHAYTESLSAEDKSAFEIDKSLMMEIYIMRSDGTGLRRLTDVKGYDGGPFFSPDGSRICWRRFAPDGATAEIYTMKTDGTDQRRLTRLGAMSWAPYFHPSADYLIFATNLHGFANFELYLVDRDGLKDPVRVTETDGFDGLPVFSPDGGTLAWTSNRTPDKTSQIFMAGWNDAKARELLGLGAPRAQITRELPATNSAIDAEDLRTHVGLLAGEAFEGRLTGTDGERLATRYVADVFQSLGLAPAGDDGTYFQRFPFVAGVSLGSKNQLSAAGGQYEVDEDWRPLAFSQTGEFEGAGVVFAGYGLHAPARDTFEEYDSYVHLDVKDKWVLAYRFYPEDIGDEQRRHLTRYAGLRYKAMIARDNGAKGLLVVNGPAAETKDDLVKLAFDASLSGTSIPAISISNALAQKLLDAAGKDLGSLQDELDKGDPVMGFELPGISLSAIVDIRQEERWGRNVLARLMGGSEPAETSVALGAHVDHLGRGGGGGSLARDEEQGQIHYGADDNASGVAGMLEIAQYLADQKAKGKLSMKHDILFAAWSGEELGLLGSNYFAAHFNGKTEDASLSPAIIAYLNMDMIGRLDQSVVLQGLGSSDYWKPEIERRNAPLGLAIVTQEDSYLPTDATSFYLKQVPILSAFTGSHGDYHTPRDTAEKLNYDGMREVARFMALMARGLVQNEEGPGYRQVAKPEGTGRAAVMRAYLGTIPDYSQGDIKGVKISGVAKDGPAEKAGLQGGDIIVSLAGKAIENIYDYTYAIEALKIGQVTEIVVKRQDQELSMTVIPASRQ